MALSRMGTSGDVRGLGRSFRRAAPMLLVLVGLSLALAAAQPAFAGAGNLRNVIVVSSILVIPGAGMTLLIASGAFDLSIGAVVALSSVVVVTALPVAGVAGALVAAVAVAALIGVFNGAAVTKLRISPLIATLATLTIVRGITLVITNGRDQITNDRSLKVLSAGTIGGIPMPVVIAAVVLVTCAYLLYQTPFGRHILAVGSNADNARLAGLPVDRVRIALFVVVAVTGALWGGIISSQLLKGSGTLGTGFELDAIAIVVIGGTALTGGKASLGGTVLGAVLVTVVRNGLNLLGVSAFYQQIAVGALLILALALQAYVDRPPLRGARVA